jgi:hypothetical protein
MATLHKPSTSHHAAHVLGLDLSSPELSHVHGPGTERVAIILEIYPVSPQTELHIIEQLVRKIEMEGLVWGKVRP